MYPPGKVISGHFILPSISILLIIEKWHHGCAYDKTSFATWLNRCCSLLSSHIDQCIPRPRSTKIWPQPWLNLRGELNNLVNLREVAEIHRAKGLRALWRGRKHEDLHTQIALALWEDLGASHVFFTSAQYEEFNNSIQPAMNGRKIDWQNHAVTNTTGLDDPEKLKATLNSPAIEVAKTKVVEGGVSGYYRQFNEIVVPILNDDPGCDGHFISPQVENPQDQMLLINWKSVDVRQCVPQPIEC